MAFKTFLIQDINQVTDLVSLKPSHPFAKNAVLYQNAGVKDLLTFGLTEKHKITANLDFLTLQQWINNLFSSINSDPSKPLIWDIYSQLNPDHFQDYSILKKYLEDDLRKVQLSEKIAEIFDDYYNYKQDGLLAGWQKQLWDQVSKQNFQGYKTQYVIDHIDELELIPEIVLIGIEYLTPIQWEFLVKIKDKMDILFYHVYPTAYENNQQSNYWQFKKDIKDQVSNLGVVEEIEVPALNRQNSLLTALKKDDSTKLQLTDETNNVRVVSAYSKKREVEELYNHILYQCQYNRVKPYEIQVLCPDINDYQPYIDAVFNSSDFPIKLKYHISDLPSGGFKARTDLVIKTFQLGDNISIKDVSTFIENGLIQKRYQLNDYSKTLEYLKRTSFIFGSSDDNQSDLSLIGWPQSKKRLIYGLTMMTNDSTFDDVHPLDELEGRNFEAVLGLIQLIDDLFKWNQIQEQSEFKYWFEQFAERYQKLFGNEEEEINPEELSIWSLFEGIYDDETKISANAFSYILTNQLESYSKNKKKYTNSITFGDMSSSKSIASKVICVIGLNDQSFPKKEVEYEFDLLKGKNIRLKKRTINQIEYQSAILAAQENLYLSYVGKNTRNNKTMLPSVFLANTIDRLNSITDNPKGMFPEVHPADHLSNEYTNIKGGRFTFIKDKKQTPQNLKSSNTEDDHKNSNHIKVSELIKFYHNPTKWYFQNILNISLFEEDEIVPDSEKFSINTLDNYTINQQIVLSQIDQSKDINKKAKQERNLPLGGFGDALISSNQNKIKPLVKRVQEYYTSKIEIDAKTIQLEDEIWLTGDKISLHEGKDVSESELKDNNLPYRIFWETSEKDEEKADSKIGKNIIDICITGAYLNAIGTPNKSYYFLQNKAGMPYEKVFVFNDRQKSIHWLKEITRLFKKQQFERPIHFYPKRFYTDRNKEIEFKTYNKHFNPGQYDNEYPDSYQRKGFNMLKNNFDETSDFEKQIKGDRELFDQTFWAILNEQI